MVIYVSLSQVLSLLSGSYEAFLDNRIISFLDHRTKTRCLTVDMRARLLFAVLVGNLDIDPDPRTVEELVAIHDD